MKERNISRIGLVNSRKKYLLLQRLVKSQSFHFFQIYPDKKVYFLARQIRKKLKLEQSECIYIYCDNVAIAPNHIVQSIYDRFREEDGLLYVNVTSIESFGKQKFQKK